MHVYGKNISVIVLVIAQHIHQYLSIKCITDRYQIQSDVGGLWIAHIINHHMELAGLAIYSRFCPLVFPMWGKGSVYDSLLWIPGGQWLSASTLSCCIDGDSGDFR